MAECLDATEEYLKEAIDCYKSKYGLCVSVDNYIIYFEPFAVIHLIAPPDWFFLVIWYTFKKEEMFDYEF